jgi:hypothetical protein
MLANIFISPEVRAALRGIFWYVEDIKKVLSAALNSLLCRQ